MRPTYWKFPKSSSRIQHVLPTVFIFRIKSADDFTLEFQPTTYYHVFVCLFVSILQHLLQQKRCLPATIRGTPHHTARPSNVGHCTVLYTSVRFRSSGAARGSSRCRVHEHVAKFVDTHTIHHKITSETFSDISGSSCWCVIKLF